MRSTLTVNSFKSFQFARIRIRGFQEERRLDNGSAKGFDAFCLHPPAIDAFGAQEHRTASQSPRSVRNRATCHDQREEEQLRVRSRAWTARIEEHIGGSAQILNRQAGAVCERDVCPANACSAGSAESGCTWCR